MLPSSHLRGRKTTTAEYVAVEDLNVRNAARDHRRYDRRERTECTSMHSKSDSTWFLPAPSARLPLQ